MRCCAIAETTEKTQKTRMVYFFLIICNQADIDSSAMPFLTNLIVRQLPKLA